MHWIRYICLAAGLATCIFALCAVSDSVAESPYRDTKMFRCNSAIVREGMMRSEVMDKCGEPTDVSTSTVMRYSNAYEIQYGRGLYSGTPFSGIPKYNEPRKIVDENDPIAVAKAIENGTLVFVHVEEWFYNFGPSRLTRKLTFIENRLDEISTGDRGY